jgi:hypothetical protein
VVETGFAQLPQEAYRKAYDAHTQGWASELAELAGYLDALHDHLGRSAREPTTTPIHETR